MHFLKKSFEDLNGMIKKNRKMLQFVHNATRHSVIKVMSNVSQIPSAKSIP